MNLLNGLRALLCTCATAVMVAGCGSAPMPSAVPFQTQPNRPIGASPDRGPSWMARNATTMDLLYVSDVGTDDVYVYSFPGGTLEGTLKGFKTPSGLCVDKAGDVYVTELFGFKILEYQHGASKPLRTLNDPNEDPGDCAVNLSTGDLAVSNVSNPNSAPGNLLVFPNAQGTPQRYANSKILWYYEFCGYDTAGNLFVDGMRSGTFELAELAKGKSALKGITVNAKIRYAGAVAWDGKDLAVGDYESGQIDRFQIGATSGKEIGVTPLTLSKYPIGFWLQGTEVIGPNDDGATVMYWNYPAGGAPIQTISGLHYPWGATVSLAQ